MYTPRPQIVNPVEYTIVGGIGTVSCSRRHETEAQGLIDYENCDEHRSKRFRLVSMAREFLETEEAQKRSASFDDKKRHERNPKRFRSSLASESLIDLTAHLSFA